MTRVSKDHNYMMHTKCFWTGITIIATVELRYNAVRNTADPDIPRGGAWLPIVFWLMINFKFLDEIQDVQENVLHI